MPNSSVDAPRLALVLSGGGARAAYQVGVLQALARRLPELRFPILTGVSAGAINAAFLGAHGGGLPAAAEALGGLWSHLRTRDVLVSDAASLGRNVARWGARLVTGGAHVTPTTRGLVDTRPLRELLEQTLLERSRRRDDAPGIPGVRRNLDAARLDALAVTTTNYSTGQSMTWVEAREFEPWYRPFRVGVGANVTVDHILASSALPLVFPAIRLGTHWHGDGGVRMTAPLSPALHLGAERILVVATRRARPRDIPESQLPEPYPPPAQIAGILMNAVFLDMLDYDAMNLDRVNELVRALPEEHRQGLRPVELLVIRPSMDLARLSREYEHLLPASFRFLTRGWGTRDLASPDTLSMLLFEAEYAKRLMELGESDASARMDEIARFVRGSDGTYPPGPPGGRPGSGRAL